MDAEHTRHTCHCGKSFIRREHLRRHQATHGERQHVCSICQRPFTRSDLLKRHLSVHVASDHPPQRPLQACDACYENKTKCDGGQRCSLCTKRGIPCTIARGKTLSLKAGPSEGEKYLAAGDVAGNHDIRMDRIIQDCQDTSFQVAPTIGEGTNDLDRSDPAREGMEYILELLLAASIDIDSPMPPIPVRNNQWVSSCAEAYFDVCHDRWALIHAPLFDTAEDSLLVVVTVVMIGSIIRDHEPAVRALTLEVHQHLHDHCMKSLTAPKDEGLDESPWPYEVYQLSLLNIIAAFELGKPTVIRNANRLLSFIIISMRENNIFNHKAVEDHQNTHFPGTFSPWLYMGRDRWRWQACVLLQLDAYMSLFTFHPPFLRLKELDLSLLASYTLRNSHGLDKFFKRVLDEPEDRQRTKIWEVAQSPHGLPASGPLVEDIQIGLSGVATKIWLWSQDVQSFYNPDRKETQERAHIQDELDRWEFQICRLFQLLQAPDVDPQAVSFLLRAYTGKEEPGEDGWPSLVMVRISELLFDISMFYYCLSLHLFADIRFIHNARAPTIQDDETRTVLTHWASSSSARQAASCAIRALQTCEQAFPRGLHHGRTLNSITKLCLSTACIVFCAWAVNSPQTCKCRLASEPNISNVDLSDKKTRQEWIRLGWPISVEGTPLCSCACDLWAARFTSALAYDPRTWEFGVQRMGNWYHKKPVA